jgi:hypothetical protein
VLPIEPLVSSIRAALSAEARGTSSSKQVVHAIGVFLVAQPPEDSARITAHFHVFPSAPPADGD